MKTTPSDPKPPETPGLVAAATSAVDQLEALPPGAAGFNDARAAAVDAFVAAYHAASETLCPTAALPPVTAESLTDFQTFCDGPRQSAPERLADLLRLAVAGKHRGLQVCLRGPRALLFIRQCAEHDAADVDAAVRRYVNAIAGVLAESCSMEAAAIRSTLPALRDRLAAVEARHAAHVAAEIDRVAAAARAAAAAIVESERQTREELAAYFEARRDRSFVLPSGAVVSGAAVAAIARRQGGRDADGKFVGAVSLDELALLKQQAEAAAELATVARQQKGA